MKKYQCPICEKTHDIYWGLEMPSPDRIFALSEEERKARVKEWEGFYFLDNKHFFVNGYIYIPFEDDEDTFLSWKVWASISHKQFVENLEALKMGERIEFDGELEDAIIFYPNSKGLKLKVFIQLTNEAINIEILVEENSVLKKDQEKPISKERVMELMEVFYHNKISKKKQFEDSFSERLRQELLKVENNYLKKGKDFVINIAGEKSVLFQVVGIKMLESNEGNDQGFGLHISFDQSFEEETDRIAKFRQTEYAKAFHYHEWDGIPTYQMNLGNDKKQLEILIKRLVEEVYEYEIESIDLDNFEA